MKSILFGSIVRDGESYLERYYKQLNELTSTYKIGSIICEGDSVDKSYQTILKQKYNKLLPDFVLYALESLIPNYSFSKVKTKVFKFDHKGQKFGSVDVSERWHNIAITWNYMFDNFKDYDQYDYFCYMESDLIWNKTTIDLLVEGMETFDAVAPLSIKGNLFYDTWGHRAYGENFKNTTPIHKMYDKFGVYMPIHSAGSCILMKTEVIKNCRLSTVDAMLGHDIVKKGYSFMLDKRSIVNHP